MSTGTRIHTETHSWVLEHVYIQKHIHEYWNTYTYRNTFMSTGTRIHTETHSWVLEHVYIQKHIHEYWKDCGIECRGKRCRTCYSKSKNGHTDNTQFDLQEIISTRTSQVYLQILMGDIFSNPSFKNGSLGGIEYVVAHKRLDEWKVLPRQADNECLKERNSPTTKTDRRAQHSK